MSTAPDFFAIVSAAEGDMRKVYDHAFLLHDHLSDARRITNEEQGALVWPASDLLATGEKLRKHCDAMYAAARELVAADRPKLSDQPIIQPGKLSIEQLFGLFEALGTICEVMDGMLCQPRFSHKANLNAAGEMLDRVQEALIDAREDIRQEVRARKEVSKVELSRLVFFAAEEWTDGSCDPEPALKGLKTALTDIKKVVVS